MTESRAALRRRQAALRRRRAAARRAASAATPAPVAHGRRRTTAANARPHRGGARLHPAPAADVRAADAPAHGAPAADARRSPSRTPSREPARVPATTGAVVLTATPAEAARRPALFRGGRFSEGVLSGDPTPHRDHARHAARRRGGQRARSRSRSRATPASTASSPAAACGPARALGHAIKARVNGPQAAHAVLVPLRRPHGRTRPSAASGRPCPPARARSSSSGSSTASTTPRATSTRVALLADEDVDFVLNLGNYISARAASQTEGVRPPYDLAPGPVARPPTGGATAQYRTRRAACAACTRPTRSSRRGTTARCRPATPAPTPRRR